MKTIIIKITKNEHPLVLKEVKRGATSWSNEIDSYTLVFNTKKYAIEYFNLYRKLFLGKNKDYYFLTLNNKQLATFNSIREQTFDDLIRYYIDLDVFLKIK